MSKDLELEMKALLAKHGLKADDAESTEVESEQKAGSEVTAVADLATSIAEKLAGIIADKKGMATEEKNDLGSHIRSKIYTSWAGVKEVEYPTDLKSLTKEEKIVTFFKALVFSKNDQNSQQVLDRKSVV